MASPLDPFTILKVAILILIITNHTRNLSISEHRHTIYAYKKVRQKLRTFATKNQNKLRFCIRCAKKYTGLKKVHHGRL